jgi:hypothetical protein
MTVSEIILFGGVFLLGLLMGWMFGFGAGHARGKLEVLENDE